MKSISIGLDFDNSKFIHTKISTISTAGVVDNVLHNRNIYLHGLPVCTNRIWSKTSLSFVYKHRSDYNSDDINNFTYLEY